MRTLLRSAFPIEKLQRRAFGIVFVMLGLLAALQIAERVVLSYYEKNWDSVAAQKSTEQLEAVTREFVFVQRTIRQIASEVARQEVVRGLLLGKSSDTVRVFLETARLAERRDVGVEIYGGDGKLVAWSGRSGPVDPHDVQAALQGKLTSSVTRGPIFTHMFVIVPVRVDGAFYGAVLVRKAVEVNYPLSNKFIRRTGLSEQLSRALGVNVELSYGTDVEPRKDGRFISSVVYGIDGRTLGVATIPRLARSAFLERISGRFEKINTALLTFLIAVLSLFAYRRWGNHPSLWIRLVALTAIIWIVRYLLLWLDVPSRFFTMSIFDPSYFASKFGGGLAKSTGDMALTAVALFVNILFVVRAGADRIMRTALWRPRSVPVQFMLGSFLTTFVFLSLRGVAAVIRSAVFDSVFRFNDPTVIIPSFELGLMVFNIFVISFCMIMVATATTWYIVSMFETGDRTSRPPAVVWGMVLFLYVLAGFLFDVLQETPLVSPLFRIAFGVALIVFTFSLRVKKGQGIWPLRFSNAVIILGLSALFFYPVLEKAIAERDRERIEALARDIVRPTDTWLKYVVDESLHQFLTDNVLDVLLYGSSEEVERLAFSCWAMSMAGRQGYNCMFLLLDPHGEELSRFAIGEQTPLVGWTLNDVLEASRAGVQVQQRGSGVAAVRVYSGALPIVAADSLLAYGLVVVSASQQSLFRGEAPTVFRMSGTESLETFYRPILLSEFEGDSLLASTAELPLQYRLPRTATAALRDSPTGSVWVSERIGSKEYETLLLRRDPANVRVIALHIEKLGGQWHLFGIVKTMMYYAIVLIGALTVVLLVRRVKGNPYRLTFRDKLLIAFLGTALVPMIVIALYVRVFAAERLEEILSERLKQETSQVEDALNAASNEHEVSTRLRPHLLALGTKSDFNVYVGNTLAISSRPELYDTGILDRRLSGSAYAAIVLQGRRFHVETESIGLYRYAVGYKPLVREGNAMQSIIAVPALYRQEEIDKEVARTNAIVFGVYAVIALIVSLVATAMANRIAAPIHKLTEATKQVARGDLHVKVHATADGEIGELIRSFEAMTRDLERSREHLVRYERKLAWQEMAKQVAHEIKNPLTPMKLAIQHLQQTYRDKVENFDQVFAEVSQMIIRQVDALGRIASEFSRFGRMPHAHLEPCNVNDVLHEALHLFEQDQRVTFGKHFAPQLPDIPADREELRRAFINIIRNGVQAMNNQGTILVSTVSIPDGVEVRIQDFGCGIPDDIKHKLFQPNFSTKTDGMGLGLAIVKKTIEDLHGTIVIESTVNKGTTVIMHFPHSTDFVHEPTSDSVR
ncbi:MAG: hypothetical protein C4326_13765 [Ignavibacteria bacterium]